MTSAGLAIIEVHREPEGLWATCPQCPGWSAAAPSWTELFRLIWASHDLLPSERQHGWLAVEPFEDAAK